MQHTKPPPGTSTGLALLKDFALERNTQYAKCFGSFRLLPDKRLLMEGDKPVRIGSRTLDLLIALVDRPGDLIRKEELMSLVWPNTHVEPCNLSVHIARLRQILGDGRDGKRFVINISGRGYRFVADVTTDVELSPPLAVDAMHNLPAPVTQLIGREDAMADLVLRLKQHRLLTVVGPGGIGKSSVADAVARELVARFKDGIWLLDLGTLTDAQLVPDAFRTALRFETVSGHGCTRIRPRIQPGTLTPTAKRCRVRCVKMAKTSKRLAQHRKTEPAGLRIRTASSHTEDSVLQLSFRPRRSWRGFFFGRVGRRIGSK
jgi:DNA-binding winged helix-turn-helix (wHTH) protein